jgi:hypothetical protein
MLATHEKMSTAILAENAFPKQCPRREREVFRKRKQPSKLQTLSLARYYFSLCPADQAALSGCAA